MDKLKVIIYKKDFYILYDIVRPGLEKWLNAILRKFPNVDYVEVDEYFYYRLSHFYQYHLYDPKRKFFKVFSKFYKIDQAKFKIDTYEKVCKALNKEKETCPYKVIKDIQKFFNGNYIINWKNEYQWKFFPKFSYFPNIGFSLWYIDDTSNSYSSFIAYKSRDIALFVGKKFVKEYENLMKNG